VSLYLSDTICWPSMLMFQRFRFCLTEGNSHTFLSKHM
jgi:hypothetical protein